MAGPVASTSTADMDAGDAPPTFAFRAPKRKGRTKSKTDQDGAAKGQGKGKAKEDGKQYEVGSERLGKYLNESEDAAKRDQMGWRVSSLLQQL